VSRVRAQLELRRVARLLREAPPQLRREMRRRIREPVKPFEAKVRSEIPGSVPDRYAGVLAPVTKVHILGGLSGSGAGYTLEIYAKGKSQDRDVKAVDAGILRHKTWGRHPWHAQKVRGGFVDRSLNELSKRVGEEIEKAVDEVARKIEGG
jgi:hypothetical protein